MTNPELSNDLLLYRKARSFPDPSASLRSRIFADAAARPSPTRAALLQRIAALTTVAWLLSLTIFICEGGLRITGRPPGLVFGTATGTGLVTVLVAYVGLSRGRSSLQRAPRSLLPMIVAGPTAIFAWKLFWSSHYPRALDPWLTRPGFRCLSLGVAMGLLPIVAFAISRRTSDPGRPGLTGLAAGVAVGCVTAFLTDLWCPVAYLPHLLLGHVLPIVLLGGLGAGLGRRVIALRYDSQHRMH